METRKKIADSNYSVSPDGKIYNDNTGRLKVPAISKGYYKVDLYKDGKRETKRIHRLVAESFIPNPNGLPEINHKDGNRLNNSIDNLEWVNRSQNMIHAYSTGLTKPHPSYGMLGKKNPNGGSKGKPIICVETNEYFKNAAEAERRLGISDSCILDVIHGYQQSTHGLHFVYA